MARKILLDGGYAFNPSTKQVVLRRIVPKERLVLITNVTQNKVIYNFSDTSLLASAYVTYGDNQLTSAITSISGTGSVVTVTTAAAHNLTPGMLVTLTGVTPAAFNINGAIITAASTTTFTLTSTVNGTYVSGGLVSAGESTVITLNYNPATAGMLTTDSLQVTVDEFSERIKPDETYADPVNKLRVSQPQSMMDTDFEYGKQDTKWETQILTNGRPFASQLLFNALTVSGMTTGAAGTRTITTTMTNTTVATLATGVQGNGTTALYKTAAAHGLTVGQYVTVTGVTPASYNTNSGVPLQVLEVPSTTSFRILANGTSTAQSTVAGTVATNVAPPVGAPIAVTDTYFPGVTGNYVVETRPGETSFTFTSKVPTSTAWASISILDPAKTLVVTGDYYRDAIVGNDTATVLAYTGQDVQVTTGTNHGLQVGNEIAVVGSTSGGTAPNGNFIVSRIQSPTVFNYYDNRGGTISGTLLGPQTSTTGTGTVGTNYLVLASATGLTVGGTIISAGFIAPDTYIKGFTGTTVELSQNLLATMSATACTVAVSVYARSQAQSVHRAFDGGVMFSSNAASNNISLVRQTRRYFRYQSGKGLQLSTGTILQPTYTIDSMAYSSPFVTVVTKERHGLQPGFAVRIFGANEVGYNGDFAAVTVVDQNTFKYIPTTAPTIATASGQYYLSILAWDGAQNRLGMFDQQNGLFFEHDGQNLWAVRRSSIFQIAGRVSVTSGSATVTGATNFATTFNKQLNPGDWIVIRGQSYRIDTIASDTSMTLVQAYRGPSASNVTVSKTTDLRIPRSLWNIDKMDGTGPSGYTLDLSKMQMFYIDYTWYGAGGIRWGFRGPKGEIIYAHKLANNNQNPMAYMRSGNLPARYEASTYAPTTKLTTGGTGTNGGVATGDTTIYVEDTSAFATPKAIVTTATGTSGVATITVGNAAGLTNGLYASASNITAGTQIVSISGTTVTLSANNAGTVSGAITFFSIQGMAVIKDGTKQELINYSGKTSNTLTGVTRAQAGSTSVTTTWAVGSNTAVVGSASGLQVGQRVIHPTLPEGTFIAYIQGTTVVFSNSPMTANPTVVCVAGGATSAQAFTYSATAPVEVFQAMPTDAPTIAHWGSSVMMDGRFDDDKSLLFTYGQTLGTTLAPAAEFTQTATASATNILTLSASNTNIVVGMYVADFSGTAIPRNSYVTAVNSPTSVTINNTVTISAAVLTFWGASTKALMSIRVAPAVDSGTTGNFGTKEVINRMQLMLRALDLTLTGTTTGNVLVLAYLNGRVYNPTAIANATWKSAVGNATLVPNSSLSQIVDYAGGNYIIQGGEATGGFFTNSTGQVDLSNVRDLGNSILGGGQSAGNVMVYPDGPDVLTIVVSNVGTTAQTVQARLSWSEAAA
jgi:hypothetical protein